jgi:hypothetical protein
VVCERLCRERRGKDFGERDLDGEQRRRDRSEACFEREQSGSGACRERDPEHADAIDERKLIAKRSRFLMAPEKQRLLSD